MTHNDTIIIGGELLSSETGSFYSSDIRYSSDNGRINAISREITPEAGDFILNARGCYVIPGLIDIHTHGASGVDFSEAKASDVCRVARENYAENGVTSIFPTFATRSIETLTDAACQLYAAAKDERNPAHLWGIHCEGVYLSHERKGAHDEKLLRKPDIDEINGIFSGFPDGKKILSIAPELDGALEVISEAAENGYVVSLAHTDATGEITRKALSQGAKSFTHLYNAMRPLGHREPGVVGTALMSDAYTELICDGFHVCPEVVRLTRRLKAPDKLVLITDSVKAAGLPDGEYPDGTLTVIMKDSRARLPDGTIAGSTLKLFDAVKNYMEFTDASFSEAVLCATKNPATLTGIYSETGSLAENKLADILIVSKDFKLLTVISGGKTVKYNQDNL